jgi:hypothetical protein
MKTKWRRGYQRDAAGRLSGGQALGASLGTIHGSIVWGAALHQHGRIQQVQQLARLGDLPLGGGSEDRTEQRADAGLCQRHQRDDRGAGLPSAALILPRQVRFRGVWGTLIVLHPSKETVRTGRGGMQLICLSRADLGEGGTAWSWGHLHTVSMRFPWRLHACVMLPGYEGRVCSRHVACRA